jgi:hypothetical protein
LSSEQRAFNENHTNFNKNRRKAAWLKGNSTVFSELLPTLKGRYFVFCQTKNNPSVALAKGDLTITMKIAQTDQEKLVALSKKLEDYEAKVDFRLKHFRGVAHESASGELASSELKVLQDIVASLKAEIAKLKKKLGIN